MTVGLTDAQINDIYKGIDPIIVQNKAARMGVDSDYAMRIAFGRAVAEALAPMWISCDVELPEDDQVVNILYWPYDNHENQQAVGSAQHCYGTFYDDAGDSHHYPSHWCKLPSVPQVA